LSNSSSWKHNSPPPAIIEAGSNVEEASYVVFGVDNNGDGVADEIYAKNGRTGEIEFSGTDASTVIQQAINAGNSIFIKAGNYTITQTIKLPSSVTLIGEAIDDLSYNGLGSRLIASSELNGPVLTNNNYTHGNGGITIKMLVIDGNKSDDVKVSGLDGIYLNNTVRSRIIDVVVYRMKDNGIHIEENGETQIARVYSAHNNGHGILMVSHSDFHISDCEIGGNRESGIVLSSCANGEITGCHIYLNNEYGVRAYDARLMRIIANRMNHNGRDGISITLDASGWDRLIVMSNQCLSNGRQYSGHNGITITGTSTIPMQYVVVIGNVCGDYENPKTQEYGIKESINADYNIVIGNVVTDNKFGGILTIGSNTIVQRNIGYVTENGGGVTIVNNDYIAHGLASTPTKILLTANSTEPRILQVIFQNSTHFQVGFWNASTSPPTPITVPEPIFWYAEV
jgi:hypothetical protein